MALTGGETCPIRASYDPSDHKLYVTYSDSTVEAYALNLTGRNVSYPIVCGPGIVNVVDGFGRKSYEEDGHSVVFIYSTGGDI